MVFSSEGLSKLSIYSRGELEKLFGISDKTLYNGVFQPKGHSSVWLFATYEKGKDRTKYFDSFDGKILVFEGQTKGRTDKKIMNHSSEGNEILVFYRKRKNQYPGFGFKYLGRFEYVKYNGDEPKRFFLKSLDLVPNDEVGD